MRLAIIALALLTGCDAAPDIAAGAGQPRLALPTAETLPVRYVSQSCDCVLRDNCVVLEERSGWTEVRNVNCAWTGDGIANCHWDQRFVDDFGNDRIAPGGWYRSDGEFEALSRGGFCAR